jgi:inhibitor of nuclear factor kappa-B kinase subunit alpha
MDLQTKIDIVRCYFAAQSSATAALRLYKVEKQLHKDPFTTVTIQRIADRFLKTGSVSDSPRSGRPSTSEGVTEEVSSALECLSHAHELGHASTRAISAVTGIPPSTVYKIMRVKMALFPFKLQLLQAIPSDEFPRRKEFAEWLLSQPELIDNVLWSDEAIFTLDGYVNTHNCVVWGTQKPETVLTHQLHSPKLSVWMGFTSHFRLLPFFFTDTINGAAYLDMLKTHVRPQLAKKRKLSTTIFMQDGAPSHIAKDVKQFLLQTFGESRVISRHFPHFWPAYSPDVNPLDFFFWGYVRHEVSNAGVAENLDILKERITAVIDGLPQQQLQNAVYNVLDRCILLVQQEGKHIQHLF